MEKKSIKLTKIDKKDRRIIEILQKNGSESHVGIGEVVGLSSSAVTERVKRLRKENVIRSFVALVDPELLGRNMCAFIQVAAEKPLDSQRLIEKVNTFSEVQECHHMAGEYSFLLKVRVCDTKALESFITDKLKALPGITRTWTQVVLSSPKESPFVDCL